MYAVWQPMLPTDFSAPTSGVLARLSDSRVQQYWDKEHALAKQLKEHARAPQPVQECCILDSILWDLAAVYPPGARWDQRLPPAVLFNGPVVDVTQAIQNALASRSGSTP